MEIKDEFSKALDYIIEDFKDLIDKIYDFFQILIFIVSIVFLSLSISGYGKLLNLNIQKNFSRYYF